MNDMATFSLQKLCQRRSEETAQVYTLDFGANGVMDAVEIFGFARAVFFPVLAPSLFILRDLRSD
jgi:hypothetical protein